MPGQIPETPKLFHILHYDKLGTVIKSGGLFSDAILAANNPSGTIIGMNKIKRRRLTELRLSGVYSVQYDRIVNKILNSAEYKPSISVRRDWYY